MKNKTLTAENFIDKFGDPNFVDDSGEPLYTDGNVQYLMVEFAKEHVKKAINEASNSAAIIRVRYEGSGVIIEDYIGDELDSPYNDDSVYVVDTKAISESYPLSNIK